MSMSLQVEAVSGYQTASDALFASALLSPAARKQEQTVPPARVDNPLEVPLAELTFRHLQTADEIAGIVHLRKEIQLVATSGAEPTFVAREKKETRPALSPPLSAAAPTSERFGSFR